MPAARRARTIAALVLGIAWLASASPASAHGFGQRFDLPLPLPLWIAGAGATVILSFVLVALFVRERPARPDHPRFDLLRLPAFAGLGHPILLETVRAFAVFFFLVTLLAGFIGVEDPYRNLIVTMVWIAWWVGLAFVCALIGDLWALANPWSTLFDWAERAFAALTGGRRLARDLPYPESLGVAPAVVVLFVFAWCELVWERSDVPVALARAALFYSLLTWLGMFLFGREKWLARGEAFTIAFGVLARFAPLAGRADPVAGPPALYLRPPGAGLLGRPVSASFLVFVLLMLATVTFDGLLDTPLWQGLVNAFFSNAGIANALFALADRGIGPTTLVMTIGLLAVPVAFVLVYLATAALMRLAAGAEARDKTDRRPGTSEVARTFVLTLLPIAVAYHLSHYASFLLTSGQFIVPLLSDPFGFGWNLFGTAGYRVNYALVSPTFFWYAAILLIVLGHVVAVYLAHREALRLFGSGAALRSQIPMLALMVGYTMLSLWIMAQPIVG